MEVREFDWDSSRKGASQLSRTKTIRLSTPKTTSGEILIFALTSPLTSLLVLPRVDKQECATPDLSCTICRYPAPTAEFFVYVTFFQRNAALPQSSVRARAGHRPCSVKPSQVHEGKLSKRLAARASSKRLRQQKIPPWANPSGVAHSCLSTLGITKSR